MKSIVKLLLIASVTINFVACTNGHFITDAHERAEIQTDFDARKVQIDADDLYSVFNQTLTQEEREAMQFLYAYIPLGDIACYDGAFFLRNVQSSLQARAEMPWGKTIPEREFRHFVLPVRVNNENLDSARWVFYAELKPRIQHLSLYDAVLEVNHWCHEHVNYTPSDSRTSSPLASIKTAYGRCGEESTFLVAALRSVGIPASKFYTTLWAHTDDNHAWVEAWVDGKWYFLGACEPEPVLNLGWFNAPASRGMLMHTKVFGKYNGPEEVMHRTPLYTEINVIDNYAPCSRAEVIVVDTEDNPIEGANVEFKLYNYAEFYTVARKTTDANGRTFLTTGNGDMLVWATHNGNFAYQKLSFGKDSVLRLQITDNRAQINDSLSTFNSQLSTCIDIIPPHESANLPTVTDKQRAENNRRFAYEDSLRNAYIATMFDEEKAQKYIESIEFTDNDPETEDIKHILIASRGNHATILEFLERTGGYEIADKIDFLNNLSAKDIRDITTEVINDHFEDFDSIAERQSASYTVISRYIRNPRVANEMLTPYRSFFRNAITEEQRIQYRENPMLLVDWVRNNIRIDAECNLGGAPIQPMGVWHARMADKRSRDIFFVALARSLDIPARIDEVTGKVQIVNPTSTKHEIFTTDINFESTEQITTPQGRLVATFKPTKTHDDPKYYYHFSISKITDEGRLQLLNYDEGESGMEQGAAWSNLLKNGTSLDCGNYLMVTGSRLANGGVLAQMNFFTIEENQTTTTELIMRQSTDQVQVIGSFNSESLYNRCETTPTSAVEAEQLLTPNFSLLTPHSVLSTTGRGYYIIGIIGAGDEPTNHALRDIIVAADQLNQWGRPMILISPNNEMAAKTFSSDLVTTLASQLTNLHFGTDIDGSIQAQIMREMKLANASLPIFIIADTFNRVVFCSQGYTIGLGEQLVKVTKQL